MKNKKLEEIKEEENIEEEIKEEVVVTEQDLIQEQIYEKSLRMQEIDALVEKNEYYDEDMIEDKKLDELLLALKAEYKVLKAEVKFLKKRTQISFFDKIPVWTYIYGLLITVFGFAPVMKKFTEFLAPISVKIMGDFLNTWFGTFLYLYLPTVLLLMVTVFIFILVYKKEYIRKFMYIILGIQTINAIITIISFIDIFRRLRG